MKDYQRNNLSGKPIQKPGPDLLHPAPGTIKTYRKFVLKKAPSVDCVLANVIAVHPDDFHEGVYVIAENKYVLTVDPSGEHKMPERGTIGVSESHRLWAKWSLNDEIEFRVYDPFQEGNQIYLGTMDIEIGFLQKNRITDDMLDPEKLAEVFIRRFRNQIFSPEQLLVFEYQGLNFKLFIKSITCLNLGSSETSNESHRETSNDRGILTPQTLLSFNKEANSQIRLKPSSKNRKANSIVRPDFKFKDMGIGGLNNEFGSIFRRAFASRVFPPDLVEKIGIQHVKGILLYGPPGNGKTLMARQIGTMLNTREPKVINGPEILNKYVGQSEENIRKLFADAEAEYKDKGEESELHIIIFDELDAICKQRGSRNDGTGVGDSVVNQLLSKMDGVDQLNNVLIIGMTNRKDMIDEALLRPGRLEVHLEIPLPDFEGRFEIFTIHTSRMLANNILNDDVDLTELATVTKNFSGAEISGLIKSASSFAFNRHVKIGTIAGVSDDLSELRVQRQDFFQALNEVKPAFGVSEEELDSCIQGGVIDFAPHIEHILSEGHLFIEQVRNSETTSLMSVLINGLLGSGKTALAASIALASNFPFIKLISPESMVGFNEANKISYLTKVFSDSSKSPLSLVVMDNIERIFEWVPIGPRFSNAILQTLMVLLRKVPTRGHKLLILATTTVPSVLQSLNMLNCFDAEITVPPVTTLNELDNILEQNEAFSDVHRKAILQDIASSTENGNFAIGIKQILMAIETAQQDGVPWKKFCEIMTITIHNKKIFI